MIRATTSTWPAPILGRYGNSTRQEALTFVASAHGIADTPKYIVFPREGNKFIGQVNS